MKNGSGLAVALPLVDDLLKADRACPSYGKEQRTDCKRYSRRSYIVNWIYEITVQVASNVPQLSTDAVKFKFKAALHFVIQLDRDEVETLEFRPLYDHLRINKSVWLNLVHSRIKDVDQGESLVILLPLLVVLAKTI